MQGILTRNGWTARRLAFLVSGAVFALLVLARVGVVTAIASHLGYGYEHESYAGYQTYNGGPAVKIDGTSLDVFASRHANLQARFADGELGTYYSPSFDDGDAGFFLGFVGGTQANPLSGRVYGPPVRAGEPAGFGYTAVSNGPVTGTGTEADPFTLVTKYLVRDRTIATDDVDKDYAEVTQTITHVSGTTAFDVAYAVKNVSGQDLKFKAYEAADLYIEGSDYGTSLFKDGPTRFVAGYNETVGRSGGIEENADTPFDRYTVTDYSDLWQQIRDRVDFDGSLITENIDNGVGVQWDDYVDTPLADGQTAEFKLRWRFAIPGPLNLTPGAATLNVGAVRTLNVTAVDSEGVPFANRSVQWSATGANSGTGTVTTNDAGQAVFSYTGVNAGTDEVTAFLDLDGDGVRAESEPQAVATTTWVAPPPPPPPPPPAPPAPPAPPVGTSTLAITRALTNVNGVVGVPVSCPAATAGCSGRITITLPSRRARGSQAVAAAKRKKSRKPVVLGKRSFSIPAGTTKKVNVRLSKKGKKALKRGGRVLIKIQTRDASGKLSKPVTIRAKVSKQSKKRK